MQLVLRWTGWALRRNFQIFVLIDCFLCRPRFDLFAGDPIMHFLGKTFFHGATQNSEKICNSALQPMVANHFNLKLHQKLHRRSPTHLSNALVLPPNAQCSWIAFDRNFIARPLVSPLASSLARQPARQLTLLIRLPASHYPLCSSTWVKLGDLMLFPFSILFEPKWYVDSVDAI